VVDRRARDGLTLARAIEKLMASLTRPTPMVRRRAVWADVCRKNVGE
jgi:Ser/Thr protein kinase RdoA (MazF antagonist)